MHDAGRDHWLCQVCADTFLSYAVIYPGRVEDACLYRSIGWIANRILDEIRTLRPKETP